MSDELECISTEELHPQFTGVHHPNSEQFQVVLEPLKLSNWNRLLRATATKVHCAQI